MKKIHIILIVLIAVAVGAIIGTISDSSTYVNFAEAFENPGREFHVVGVLNRDKESVYNPETNPDIFTFYLFDSDSVEKKVILNSSKPQDFDRSDQIVLIGKANSENNVFEASSILLKCPSKYEDGAPTESYEGQAAI